MSRFPEITPNAYTDEQSELAQRRVQGTPIDAEAAVSAYGLDVIFAIPFPTSAVDEGCDALQR